MEEEDHLQQMLFGSSIHPSSFGQHSCRRRHPDDGLGEQEHPYHYTRRTDDHVYESQTPETRAAYEDLLDVFRRQLGAQPLDVLAGAADEVLATLLIKRDNGGIDNPAAAKKRKKKEIEELLNPISDDMFAKITSIGDRITDFHHDQKQQVQDDKQYEYRANDMMSLHRKHVLLSDDDDDKDDSSHQAPPPTVVDAHDIDACWLHSKVCQAYGADGQELITLAEEVLRILADEQGADDRAAENRLAALFDYDKLDLIRLLLRNRRKIVWCTRLPRAQDEEQRDKIEQQMAADPRLAPILLRLYMQQPEHASSQGGKRGPAKGRDD